VSGKTEITYSGTSDGVNGNKWGSGNAITFSGSGDVNGMTATYTAVIQDGGQANSNTSETFASSSLMLDMGDMGTVGFDQGVGEFGVGTIDDKMPYAYEEIWTYTGGSNGLRAAGDTNVLGYKNTFMGVSLSVEIDPGHTNNKTTGGSGDGSNTGAGTNSSGYNYALSASPIEGMTVGFGHGKEELKSSTTEDDNTFTTGYVTYAAGPVTIGYQQSSANGGSASASSNEVELYGVSFNVNDNFAISVNQMDNEFDKAGVAAVDVTEETTGFGASYTMGAASLRILNAETSNKGGVTTALDVEHTEVSLLLAF